MTQDRYRIDVNGFRVRQCKEGNEKPCIRITDSTAPEGSQISYAKSVSISGPSRIVQATFDPENPNTPFIWIETDGPIEVS